MAQSRVARLELLHITRLEPYFGAYTHIFEGKESNKNTWKCINPRTTRYAYFSFFTFFTKILATKPREFVVFSSRITLTIHFYFSSGGSHGVGGSMFEVRCNRAKPVGSDASLADRRETEATT